MDSSDETSVPETVVVESTEVSGTDEKKETKPPKVREVLPHPKLIKLIKKPDEDKMKADCDAVKAEMNDINTAIRQLRYVGGGNTELRIVKIREEMDQLKASLVEAIKTRDAIQKEQEAAERSQTTQVQRFKQVNKQFGKYKTAELVDAKVRKLEAKVSNSQDCQEEKAILKKITALNLSKLNLGKIDELKQQTTEIRAEGQTIRQRFQVANKDVKNKEYRITKLEEDIGKLSIQKAANEVKAADNKVQIDAKEAQIQVLLAKQKKIRDDYYQTLREATRSESLLEAAKRQEDYRQRQTKRDEIRQRNELRQAEILAQIPWEMEMDCCDSLIAYLRSLLPTPAQQGSTPEVVAVNLPAEYKDGRDTLKCLVRSNEEEMFGKSTTGRRNKNQRNQRPQKEVPANLSLKIAPQTMKRFSQLELTPPVYLDEVPESIAQVEAIKEMFKTLPRDARNPFPNSGLSSGTGSGGGRGRGSGGRGGGRGGRGSAIGTEAADSTDDTAAEAEGDADADDLEDGELAVEPQPHQRSRGKKSSSAFIASSDDFPTMGDSETSAPAVPSASVWGQPRGTWGKA